MAKSWTFTYYGWFGDGDSSDDLDYTAIVTDEEYNYLANGGNDDKSHSIQHSLRERIQEEIEDYEASNYSDRDEMPSISVRWPWN